jgi:hypothetical protein
VNGNFTLFKQSGGAGSGPASGDFIKDAFQDISLLPTNNTSLTSEFFGNTDAPKYGAKTLWIKAATLIEDRSKWISNKPTYKLTWSEPWPDAVGYVAGNIKIHNFMEGICIEMRDIDDVFGVSGRIRRTQFLVNPTQVTSVTSDILIDGVDTTRDVTSGDLIAAADGRGLNKYNAFQSDSANATDNIHDYRLTVNVAQTLRVSGVVVYFENGTQTIEVGPGVTYVDKTKAETTVASTLALPVIAGRLGGKTVVYKTDTNVYAKSTIEPQNIETVGVGTIDTNIIDVTTGHGASFRAGMGIVSISSGTTFYVGSILSVSTDAITVGPTLPFGVSGPLYRSWYASSTLAINASLYQQKMVLDFGQGNNPVDALGFGVGSSGDFYYSDPKARYRAWGNDLQFGSVDVFRGLLFASGSALQLDGDFCAAEIELAGAGIFHATVTINGTPGGWNVNEGFTGVVKKTIFSDAGPGWNSFVLATGNSFGNCVVTKVTMFERRRDIGITVGALAEFDTFASKAQRTALNASMMQLGGALRIYADQLYLTGDWVRAATHVATGGVRYVGSSTNSALKFQFYGSEFAFLGTVGTSAAVLLDGASTSIDFNQYKSTTLGFHTVTFDHKGGTAIIEGIEFNRGVQGELVNSQTLKAVATDRATKVFTQTQTPLEALDGDIWVQQKEVTNQILPSVWLKLFGLWNKLMFAEVAEDPTIGALVKTHGSTNQAAAQGTQTVEHFNLIAWQAGAISTLGVRYKIQRGDHSFGGLHHIIDGANASDALAASNHRYNKIAWDSAATRGTTKNMGASAPFAGKLQVNKGSNNNADTGAVAAADSWNGTAWAAMNAFTDARCSVAAFVVLATNILSCTSGVTTATSYSATHDTKTSADASATATAVPVVGAPASGNTSSGGGHLISAGSQNTDNTATYEWNGTAWSAAITQSYTQSGYVQHSAGAYYKTSKVSINTNGALAAGTVLGTTQTYVAGAFSASVTSSTTRNGPVASII